MARGDHIYVNRYGGMYSHHGIDCGDGTVIHFGAPNWLTERKISRVPMAKFARGDEIHVRDYTAFRSAIEEGNDAKDLARSANARLNRLLDTLRGISVKDLDFSPDAVVSRAESRLGEKRFNLFFNNCEHFASWCATGISNSEQIFDIWRAALPTTQFLNLSARSWLSNAFDNARL